MNKKRKEKQSENVHSQLKKFKPLTIEAVPLEEGNEKPGQFSPRTLKTLHPLLPRPPFYMLMVAPSGVGKTTLLMNMICREEYYGKKFEKDHIIVWCGTKDLDPIWNSPWLQEAIDPDNIFSDFSQDQLQQVVDQIKEERSQNDKRPYLLIFDDMITEGICSNVPWMVGMLEKLSMWGRHVGISTIVLSQKYNMISRKIRLRDTVDWIIFKTSKQEEKEIAVEQSARMTEQEFISLYQHATAEPFSFLHISGATQDPAEKYRKRFESFLKASVSEPSDDLNTGEDDL